MSKKIENIFKGSSDFRLKKIKPSFYVTWIEDGECQCAFYKSMSEMYDFYDFLIEQQNQQKTTINKH